MEIDWPRTLTVGGLTAAVMVAIYLADVYEAYLRDEPTAGCAPLVGMAAGVLLGVLLGNLLLT